MKKTHTTPLSKKQDKKTVVVTGGAGFLGSTLVPALIDAGYTVHVIDNLVSGKKERVPKEAQLHVVDICDSTTLEKLFATFGPIHTVFHLAALPRVPFSIDHPKEAHLVNVDGVLSVFEAARKAHVRRIVYSGSSSAYGDQTVMPLREDMCPNPKSPYAVQKLYGEYLARQYSLHYGIETVCFRYFNIFGPHFDPNGPYAMAIGKFLVQRKNKQPLTITGDGSQTRDCVYATDVARANILAAESPKVGKGEVINIGSGRNPSILEIARLIGGEIIHVAPRVEPHDTLADISRAKKLLGWKPLMTIEKGILELKKMQGIN